MFKQSVRWAVAYVEKYSVGKKEVRTLLKTGKEEEEEESWGTTVVCSTRVHEVNDTRVKS